MGLLMSFDVCNTFIILCTSCEFGQRLANAFSEINDLMDQFQWYRFPIKVQRILPMVIVLAQKRVSYECFGSFSCGRKAFKIVCEIEFI